MAPGTHSTYFRSQVDTHKAIHVAVVIDDTGAVLGVDQSETNRAGYRQLRSWM